MKCFILAVIFVIVNILKYFDHVQCSQTIEKQNCKHQTCVGFVYTYSSTVYTKYKLTKKITEYACNFLDQEFYQVRN